MAENWFQSSGYQSVLKPYWIEYYYFHILFVGCADVDNLAELQGLPAKMPKIKKFSIFTYSTTSKGTPFILIVKPGKEVILDCILTWFPKFFLTKLFYSFLGYFY